jgi:hypothetical protein
MYLARSKEISLMPESLLLMFDRVIPVSAPLSGHRLIPGVEGSLGLPVEAYLRLYAVAAAGAAKRIETLDDVLALVEEVRSKEEAIQLLCLETAPETHFLFPNSHYLDIRPRDTLERIGDVIESAAFAANYRPLLCEAVGDSFNVSRDLIRPDTGQACILVRRTEYLSRAATYRLVGETPIGAIDSSKILLPDYE